MKLTNKDKEFLERLRILMESKDLTVDLQDIGGKRMVLRKNYGDKIEQSFDMTRQGVRWRFHRVFSDIYVSAYETIYFVETMYGTSLRRMAMEIARERVELRKKAKKVGGNELYRR